MGFIKIPNLPQKKVTLAIVDRRLDDACRKKLAESGVEIIMAGPYPGVCSEISCHPDIFLHHVGDRRIVHAPSVDELLIAELAGRGFELVCGKTELGAEYPADIAYNVARVGNIAFHNLKFTDPVLAEELSKAGVRLVHVNQGYAKCAVSVVDERSIITSDKGIAKVAVREGLDVLLTEPDEYIDLYGMTGFIGGATGKLDRGLWAVAGDFNKIRSFEKISEFLSSKNIEIMSLGENRIMDIGTIIPLEEAG